MPIDDALTDTPRPPRAPLFRRIEPHPFQITERDLDILFVIGTFQVLQSRHLDVLFPEASFQHLRRRLKYLFHAGLVVRPEAQRAYMLEHHGSRSLAYLLTQAGADLVAQRRGVRFILKQDDLKFSQLAHTLEVTDIMVAMEAACRCSESLAFEPFPDVLARSPRATRTELTPERWKVDISHRGIGYTFHLRPDGIFSVCHKEAAEEGDPRARKYFMLENDRGTTPIERADLYQTSILRKYLSYQETHRAGVHTKRFSMNNMRVLFVGKSRRRIAASCVMCSIPIREKNIKNNMPSIASMQLETSASYVRDVEMRIRVGFLMRLFLSPANVGLKAGSFANIYECSLIPHSPSEDGLWCLVAQYSAVPYDRAHWTPASRTSVRTNTASAVPPLLPLDSDRKQ